MSRVRRDAGQSRPAEPRILDAGDADCGEAGHSEIADAGSALGARLSGGRWFCADRDSRSGWGRLAVDGPGWEEGWIGKHEAPRGCHGARTAGCFSRARLWPLRVSRRWHEDMALDGATDLSRSS